MDLVRVSKPKSMPPRDEASHCADQRGGITGAASGIGRAGAWGFAGRGRLMNEDALTDRC